MTFQIRFLFSSQFIYLNAMFVCSFLKLNKAVTKIFDKTTWLY